MFGRGTTVVQTQRNYSDSASMFQALAVIACWLHVAARSRTAIKADMHFCRRSQEAPRTNINNTLSLVVETFPELAPKVLSTDPWVIYFDRFVSEAEIRACEAHLGSKKFAHMDNRESLFCFGSCEQADIMQTLVGRAGNITRVPQDNIEFVQAVRYKEGMSFKVHAQCNRHSAHCRPLVTVHIVTSTTTDGARHH